MKGIVIVPAWRRPDFLWACLTRLFQADGWQDYEFWVSIDRDPDLDVPRVAHWFQGELAGPGFGRLGTPIQLIDPGTHHFSGNSYNVLRAYERAANKTGGLIYLVEEDVFVGKGFFRYHEAAHAAAPECFCVSACRDQNAPAPALPPSDRTWIYERPTYQSLGVSFRSNIVRMFTSLVPMGTNYFAEPTETLAGWFPMTRIPRAQAEQDGLIGRVLEDRVVGMDMKGAIYPMVPRAFHAGFHGYNRSGGQPLHDGTPAERGQRLLEMSEAEMNARADSRYRDITVCDLDAVEPDPLVLRLAAI